MLNDLVAGGKNASFKMYHVVCGDGSLASGVYGMPQPGEIDDGRHGRAQYRNFYWSNDAATGNTTKMFYEWANP